MLHEPAVVSHNGHAQGARRGAAFDVAHPGDLARLKELPVEVRRVGNRQAAVAVGGGACHLRAVPGGAADGVEGEAGSAGEDLLVAGAAYDDGGHEERVRVGVAIGGGARYVDLAGRREEVAGSGAEGGEEALVDVDVTREVEVYAVTARQVVEGGEVPGRERGAGVVHVPPLVLFFQNLLIKRRMGAGEHKLALGATEGSGRGEKDKQRASTNKLKK